MTKYIYSRCKGAKKQRRKFKVKFYSFLFLGLLIASGLTYSYNWFEAGINEITAERPLLISYAKASLTPQEEILQIAEETNFQWKYYLLRLADCESKFDQFALNSNGAYGIDRGIFQINSRYHPITNECAFNIECATKWTINAINEGHQSWWVCDKLIK